MMGRAQAILALFATTVLFRALPTLFQDLPVRSVVFAQVVNLHLPKARFGAEVGVWRGHSSIGFLRLLPNLQRLYLVDSWLNYKDYTESGDAKSQSDLAKDQEITEDRIYFFGQKPKILKGLSSDVAEKIPDGSLDFVFIDANHAYEYVMSDIRAWTPKLRPNGVLGGHDYGAPGHDGVKRAVDEVFGTQVNFGKDYVWWIRI